jgi:hypothetical protein
MSRITTDWKIKLHETILFYNRERPAGNGNS